MARAGRPRLAVAVVVAAALGIAAGWWFRAHREPTAEERVHEAAERIKKRVEALTR